MVPVVAFDPAGVVGGEDSAVAELRAAGIAAVALEVNHAAGSLQVLPSSLLNRTSTHLSSGVRLP